MADAQQGNLSGQLLGAAAKNRELLASLASTDYAPPTLKEQRRFISELETLIRDSDLKIKNLDRKRQEELKGHEKYRDSHVKRFMYKASGKKDKFSEKAAKEERDYFEVLQQEHAEKQANETLLEQLAQAEQRRDELEGPAQLHADLQRQLDELYQSIFAGPTPQFPEEDEKERASEETLYLYHDTRTKVEAETQAVKLLTEAKRQFAQAVRDMNSALSHSRMDMFGGGTITDMMERNALSRADACMRSGMRLTDQARSSSPFVEPLPNVRINQGNLMSDVFFDNIFTDMAFHDEIQRGMGELQRCAMAEDQQLHAAKQRLEGLQGQLRARETELESSRKELQKARESVFEKISQGQTGGADVKGQ